MIVLFKQITRMLSVVKNVILLVKTSNRLNKIFLTLRKRQEAGIRKIINNLMYYFVVAPVIKK